MLNKNQIYTHYTGAVLLEKPLLNKGLAFTKEERSAFNLNGLLPNQVETIKEQTERAWGQFCEFKRDISKHVYLRNIQNTNETLFYNLVRTHLSEMLPMIYTPTVGEACEHFSDIYRRPRGLFISWPNRHHIDEMLQNFAHKDIQVIVVTDGERILGLGDQGIGGMGIPIGKLSLYTACGGINPSATLPIMLDVVRNAHPTVLIGVSGQPGLFTEDVIKEMHRHCPRPIIMPLSNPTSRAEAQPQDLIAWTRGDALVATGSPFAPVFYDNKLYDIAQCNSAYIFPGLGLGILAAKAKRVTDGMLMAASQALADYSPVASSEPQGLLPPLAKWNCRRLSMKSTGSLCILLINAPHSN